MKDGNHGMKAVLLIVAALIGAGVAYPVGRSMADEGTSNNSMTSVSSTTTKAADLRVTLNNLLREHVTTNLAVTYSIIDKAPEARMQAAIDTQTANAVEIANAVGSIYGEDAKKAITTPFVNHLTQSNNYAKAVANGDEAAKQSSLKELQTSLREVATVFNSVIPSVPTDALYDALNEHEDLMNQVAAAYQAGDINKAYELEDQAMTQISGGADVLAKGIVASKPNDFK
jgi:hypothetical protein